MRASIVPHDFHPDFHSEWGAGSPEAAQSVAGRCRRRAAMGIPVRRQRTFSRNTRFWLRRNRLPRLLPRHHRVVDFFQPGALEGTIRCPRVNGRRGRRDLVSQTRFDVASVVVCLRRSGPESGFRDVGRGDASTS